MQSNVVFQLLADRDQIKRARRGRPKGNGAGEPVMVRLQPKQLKALDNWIGDHPISRPAAVRELLAWAFTATARLNRLPRGRHAE